MRKPARASWRWRWLAASALVVLVVETAGCSAPGTPTLPGYPGTEPAVNSAGEAATPTPEEPSRPFRSYQHPTGVFMLDIPDTWEPDDRSTGQRLQVDFIPPVGYGSRVSVDVTHEGPLSPGSVRELAESYVHLHYIGQPGYSETTRYEEPDGRLVFVFRYDDGLGASGTETLTIWQVGPYFSALHAFLDDEDVFLLGGALESIADSFALDALSAWGSVVATINPADLELVNTLLWRDPSGITYVMGEVVNHAAASIQQVDVFIAVCDGAGIVQRELSGPAALYYVEPGGTTPFAVSADGLAEGVTICGRQARAEPATPDPRYTTVLRLEPEAGYNAQRQLVVQGMVQNITLAPLIDLEVILLVYDSSGRLIGCQVETPAAERLMIPGEELVFSHTFTALGGSPYRYLALGQARYVTALDPSLAPGADGG